MQLLGVPSPPGDLPPTVAEELLWSCWICVAAAAPPRGLPAQTNEQREARRDVQVKLGGVHRTQQAPGPNNIKSEWTKGVQHNLS